MRYVSYNPLAVRYHSLEALGFPRHFIGSDGTVWAWQHGRLVCVRLDRHRNKLYVPLVDKDRRGWLWDIGWLVWEAFKPRLAITIVQSGKNGTSAPGGNSATWGTGNTTAGNLLVACLAVAVAIADPGRPSGWVQAVNKNTGTVTEDISYYANCPSQASTGNFGTTGTANASAKSLVVAEFSGCATTSVLDQTAVNSGSSTTADSGTATTSGGNANEVCVAGYCDGGGTTFSAPTNSFNLRDQVVGMAATNSGALSYRIVSATGAYSSALTMSTPPPSIPWAGAIATFLQVASATAFAAPSLIHSQAINRAAFY